MKLKGVGNRRKNPGWVTRGAYLVMANMMAATVNVDATVPTKAKVRMDPMFLEKNRAIH